MNTFDETCAALDAAKRLETNARDARIALEEKVIALMQRKLEGSVVESSAQWKATATFGYNRSIDPRVLSAIRSDIPDALFDQAFEYKPAIKLAGLRYLMNNEIETYGRIAQALTVKPAKPSVKVERVTSEDQKEAA